MQQDANKWVDHFVNQAKNNVSKNKKFHVVQSTAHSSSKNNINPNVNLVTPTQAVISQAVSQVKMADKIVKSYKKATTVSTKSKVTKRKRDSDKKTTRKKKKHSPKHLFAV